MFTSVVATVIAASAVSAAVLPAAAPESSAVTIPVTPHEQYSSSIGVLGCKVDVNHIAYWPMPVDCNNVCVKVTTKGGRSTYLLHVDQSGGAYDISYDAYNYLVTGHPAYYEPITGGAVEMTYEFKPAQECAGLMEYGKLPLSAANSMNFLTSCQPDSWAATHHTLYNIQDPICKYGIDEECTLDLAKSNQPSCPHQLGINAPTHNLHVLNVEYGTGKGKLAQ